MSRDMIAIIIALQVVIVSFFALSTLFNPPPDFNYTTMAYITRNLAAVLAIVLASGSAAVQPCSWRSPRAA